eukprot:gene5549-7669_t
MLSIILCCFTLYLVSSKGWSLLVHRSSEGRIDSNDRYKYSHLQRNVPANRAEKIALFLHKKNLQKPSLITLSASAAISSNINKAAIKAILNLLSTCSIGAVAGKIGLLDQNAISILSKLIFNIFQPCLLFVNVANVIASIDKSKGFSPMYLLPFLAMVQIMIGFIIGKLFSLIIYGRNRKPNSVDDNNAKQLLACTTFANSGPLPFVFVDSLFRSNINSNLLTKSNAYISLYLLGWSPLFWILGPAILSETDSDSSKTFIEKLKVISKRVFSPPVLASIFGMIVGFVPTLNKFLLHKSGFLNPLFEAMRTLGTAYLPAVLLVLAGSLTMATAVVNPATTTDNNTTPSDLKIGLAKQVLAIYFARFFIMPTLSFGLFYQLRRYFPAVKTIFKNDPLLLFVLLLETCMPSAQNTTVILQLIGNKLGAAKLARVLMIVYVLGVPAISFWLVKILEVTKLVV